MIEQVYLKELLELGKGKSGDEFTKLKMQLCRKYKIKQMPTNIEILLSAPAGLASELKNLQTKPTRSKSGVAVVAVMTRPYPCPHGKCSTCPGGPESAFGDVPQSYTGKEPATRRAIRNNFDPYLQVMNRLEQYVVTGHITDKIELIVMGGTFPSFPVIYQNNFIRYCFQAMNDFSGAFFRNGELDLMRFKEFFELPGDIQDRKRQISIRKKLLAMKKRKSDLGREQVRNEKSHVRCVSLVVETRPDYAGEKYARRMLMQGVTKVELGVQSVFDDALDAIERGHTVADTVSATRALKEAGFKITYHLMPGLPGISYRKDLEGLRMVFSSPDFRPDMLKIYPCMVLKGTRLYESWKKKRFSPLSTKMAVKLIAEFKTEVPRYVRIMRVQRDIPTMMTEAGVDRTNLRQYIHEYMDKSGMSCNCIRCREAGRVKKIKGKAMLGVYSYEASEGTEFFISVETENAILGFCRLRFNERLDSKNTIKGITSDSAFVRELHVYGEAERLGNTGKIQHRGWGKKLLTLAEKISKENKKRKMVVISGVGAREYYRKMGYKKEGTYMVKLIS